MIATSDIAKLAELSRLTLSDDEAAQFQQEIESILSYVSRIQQSEYEEMEKTVGAVHTVMRDDTAPHARGAHTHELLEAAPQRDGNFVAVKKVLQQ